MDESILNMMAARRGHFLLESGHHGDLWLDVDRLFVHLERLRPIVEQLSARLAPYDIAAVCGPLTGGAFLAQMVAVHMGVAFTYVNRVVGRTESTNALFQVEYPMPRELGEFVAGRRVAIVNDVINAGSAVRGAAASLRAAGANLVAIAALLTLGDAAADLASQLHIPLESLAHISNQLWTPDECPLCRDGQPLIQ